MIGWNNSSSAYSSFSSFASSGVLIYLISFSLTIEMMMMMKKKEKPGASSFNTNFVRRSTTTIMLQEQLASLGIAAKSTWTACPRLPGISREWRTRRQKPPLYTVGGQALVRRDGLQWQPDATFRQSWLIFLHSKTRDHGDWPKPVLFHQETWRNLLDLRGCFYCL